MNTTVLQPYQQQLVESIRTKYPVAEQVLAAFSRIPRHPFISHYYVHIVGTSEWRRHEQSDTIEWYEYIYQDQSLTTCVDQYGRTLSSSSQPGIMASVLDALDVQPGMRVLEIGTGTGYNAALLAALTGDPHLVTTIDIDAIAVEKARHTLHEVVGEGMVVIQGDGTQGYGGNAPYDRIIVTASTPIIPRSWVEQLAPDGVLVSVLQPEYTLSGGVLRATKQDTMLIGQIVRPASFMVLRGEVYKKRKINVSRHAAHITSFQFAPEFFKPYLLQENANFAFFLYSSIPEIYVFQWPQEEKIVYYQEGNPQSYVVFQSSTVELCGERLFAFKLWTRLVNIYALWLQCGQPIVT